MDRCVPPEAEGRLLPFTRPPGGKRPGDPGRQPANRPVDRRQLAAYRAFRTVLDALEMAEEHASLEGLLDVPLSSCPRDTWRNRFPALKLHLARFMLGKRGPGNRG